MSENHGNAATPAALSIEYRDASHLNSCSRRVRAVEASVGDIRRIARTKPEAKAAVLAAVQAQAEHAFTRRYLSAGGVTFALHYCDGWTYDIIRDGRQGGSTSFEASSEYEAFEKMRHHFDQYNEAIAA